MRVVCVFVCGCRLVGPVASRWAAQTGMAVNVSVFLFCL